ncbi:MAG: deoxyribodipyrimidine photolyase [Acidimicrobiales bacterium]|nr:deoxyribodipyrimidine photolyase [Acidimicrobiales bacterium]
MTRSTARIDEARINRRRDSPPGDGLVLYWMQQAQRAEQNPALEYAIQQANKLDKTLAVVFCVVPDYPEASARHFTFMLEGLQETEAALERRGIRFEALIGQPADVIEALGHRVALLVMDTGYLPTQRQWYEGVSEIYDGPVHQIETDVVVPTHLVSDRMETAARTIRPKIEHHLDNFIIDLRTTALDKTSVAGGDSPVSLTRTARHFDALDLSDVPAAVRTIGPPDEPGPVAEWSGGTAQAKARLRHFCDTILPEYSTRRNHYDREDSSSKLSPYLHFGQLSPVSIVDAARSSGAPSDEVDAFVDEIVVRRELAINYVVHCDDFDGFGGLPEWARTTLNDHRDDSRRKVVTARELEMGSTDDELWNAIMNTIRNEGWVHNQLRMYWGKQIMYWTNTPEHAFRTLLSLNNKWFLDGRDPNSYANVAWCFGRHDQGFQERDVIGKVRPFTDQALRRKGDLDGWLERSQTRDEP